MPRLLAGSLLVLDCALLLAHAAAWMSGSLSVRQRSMPSSLWRSRSSGSLLSQLPFRSASGGRAHSSAQARRMTALTMALDYRDPIVAEEFAKVQGMEFEDVEEELMESGIPVSASVNDMDAKLMLVEVRLRMSGRMPGSAKAKPQKTKFSSKFEEATYTKPVFKELVDEMKKRGDHNAVNVAVEYLNSRKVALQRYGDSYKNTIAQIERALKAAPPVKTKVLRFSGFPANMGEAACKMTLEALGPIVSFECNQSDDFPILIGKVEYEDIEAAKKAVEQYNGMDMGIGTKLELASV